VPRSVKWRDTLLTLMMWGFFAALLDIELPKTIWSVFVDRLMPFLLIAVILVGSLIIFSLRTLWRRSRAVLLPQPAPLETADQALRAGLDEAELSAAREQRIVIVHIDSNGRHRIEVPHRR
jgi:hypothetical protein